MAYGCKAANDIILSAYKSTNNKNMFEIATKRKADIEKVIAKLTEGLTYKQKSKELSKSKTVLYYLSKVTQKDYKFSATIKTMTPIVNECQEKISKELL